MNEIDERSRWDWEEKYIGQRHAELRQLVRQYGPPPVGLIEDFEDLIVAYAEVADCRDASSGPSLDSD